MEIDIAGVFMGQYLIRFVMTNSMIICKNCVPT